MDRFARLAFDTLSAHIAVMDMSGKIIAVNQSWRDFGQTNGLSDNDMGEGIDYLKICDAATGPGSEGASEFAAGLRSVMSGDRERFSMEYPCHSPSEPRWFMGRVSRFIHDGTAYIVVAHENVTQRKLAEEALRSAHGDLEKRVEDRTAQLTQANQRLQQEIEDRKEAEKTLQEALEELEGLKEQLQLESCYLREEIKLEHNFEEIIGQSDALKYVLFRVQQVAPTDATVLILGETGTGKELVARAIHNRSPRKDRPLVKVNCAGLPANLIESELFGREKGAFTGAHQRQTGRFELANGSTILLDEIGELPLELQPKLLRVLQDGEFQRLGSPQTVQVDVRVIAATNRDLEVQMREGRFRRDLWYRLNVFPVTVPPLRQRQEDIPMLVQAFVKRFCTKLGRSLLNISNRTMQSLQAYSWPGNVRELENVIERAVITTAGRTLRLAEALDQDEMPAERLHPRQTLDEMERSYVLRILEETNWRIEGQKGAAKILGLNPSTLRGRLRKLGLKRPSTSALPNGKA
jgi:transcriptional regulator with GAF, ATPase, and Fis domain